MTKGMVRGMRLRQEAVRDNDRRYARDRAQA